MPNNVNDPWYLKQRPPVFCMCCLPCYRGFYPTRRCCLFTSVLFWIIGICLFIAVFLLCYTIDCGYTGGIMFPLIFLLLWIGYCLFHCSWAAHLLEDESGDMRLPMTQQDVHAQEASPFQLVEDEAGAMYEKPTGVKTGYWQFAERDAWQAVSSRDRLQ